MSALKDLKQRIARKKARVAVIGLGYVGLPLAVSFAKKGLSVYGVDLDVKKVSGLNRGHSHILDVPSEEVKKLVRAKLFHATCDYAALSQCDAVVICVPTPLNKKREPDLSYIIGAAGKIARYLKRGQLVVLESTTYPGTTDEELLPLFEKSGLKAERDFFLAFSPERVDPGNALFDTVSIPKVVGGVGPVSLEAAKALYGSVMKKVVGVSSAKTAEMVKLLENSFRSVNIAFINEMAIISHRLGVDIWEVIEAAKTKPFGFMPFYPGPGTGGHCLPIDPLYLSWKSKSHGFEARVIELASELNKAMPWHIVERVSEILGRDKRTLKGSSVLVLGVAYKKNVDDPRESPALDVIEHLLGEGARVSYSDPFIPSVEVGKRALSSVAMSPLVLKKQDAVVILTDHSAFDYAAVAKFGRRVLDSRNVLRRFAPKKNIFFL